MSDLYTPEFFDMIDEWSQQSADVMVPRIVAAYAPASVVDVGCGGGAFVSAFHQAGAPCDGYDPFAPFYRDPSPLDATYDLAVCLEVVEHVAEEEALGVVAMLVRLAPRVVFSAATPGQGGVGHVNEREHAYWVAVFEGLGYRADRAAGARLAAGTAAWYSDNCIVMERR